MPVSETHARAPVPFGAAQLRSPDDPIEIKTRVELVRLAYRELVVGTQMQATLSLDHRVIDGAMAAQYLASLKEFIEEPETLVI